MIDVIVEEMESPDSEDGLDSEPIPYRHYTLVMKSLKQPASTYLLIDSKEEKVIYRKYPFTIFALPIIHFIGSPKFSLTIVAINSWVSHAVILRDIFWGANDVY